MIPEDYECDGQISINDYLVEPQKGTESDINIFVEQFTNETQNPSVCAKYKATE